MIDEYKIDPKIEYYTCKGRTMGESSFLRRVVLNKENKELHGHNNVELANKVHTFYVGDNTNPHTRLIYQKLDYLFRKMKEMSYKTSSTL
jgi:hypothetical protein